MDALDALLTWIDTGHSDMAKELAFYFRGYRVTVPDTGDVTVSDLTE